MAISISVVVDWPSFAASAGTVAVAVAGTPAVGFVALQEFLIDRLTFLSLYPSGFIWFPLHSPSCRPASHYHWTFFSA